MQTPVRAPKEIRMVVRIDAEFADRLDNVAFRRFDGNRSLLVRQAIRDLLERTEMAEPDSESLVAA